MKPAVLGVMLWKREKRILSPVFRSLNSWKKKKRKGKKIRIAVTEKIILDWTLYFLKCIPWS